MKLYALHPRYPLLLTELLKKTGPNHPDYQNTHDALTEAKLLCKQVRDIYYYIVTHL